MRKTFYLKARGDKSAEKISEQILNIRNYLEERYKISVIDMAVSWDSDNFVRSMKIEISYEDPPQYFSWG
ncbi:hypothetical protein [Chryseobacterium sp.]|jgi:hypothetical protein|uniref:hypothetical protein n=1 Tax=Chryseobacterium sp. TaxID=1871047 RepID=UPI002843506F|nr:hypothetical protein [Chryseobacterium sp.]MDR3026051.1 hypothetical protein [Chryseobacterium sp.]